MDEIYFEASSILSQLDEKKDSFRNLIFQNYHHNKKLLYKICFETLSRRETLEKIVLKLPKLAKDENFAENPHLLFVLLYEYLYGYGLNKCPYEWRRPIEDCSGELAQLKNVVSSKKSFNDSSTTSNDDSRVTDPSNAIQFVLPRYVRINSLKTTVDEVVEKYQNDGWTLLETDSSISRKKYRTMLDELREPNFIVDPQIEDFLVFPAGTDLHADELVTSGCIIMQDKSSSLASTSLECPPGATVVDLCAAPGIKTSNIAAAMKNEGKIFAYDKAFDRFRVMEDMLYKHGVTCAEVTCTDFLKLNFQDKKFRFVTHALLDPPCSGSGIVKRLDFLTDSKNEVADEQRLKRLANLQTMMLKHALTIPNLQRLVYSTCSVHVEENERVVAEALAYVENDFQLVKAAPFWKHRGKRQYEFGKLCVRASAEKDRTNGFFVAVFERKRPS